MPSPEPPAVLAMLSLRCPLPPPILRADAAATTADTTPDTVVAGGALLAPQPAHHKLPLVHAHFFIDETLRHGNLRLRLNSAASDAPAPQFPPAAIPGAQFPPAVPPLPYNPSPASPTAPPIDMLKADDGTHHVLLGVTGATLIIKTKSILAKLREIFGPQISIHVILTAAADRIIAAKGGAFPADVTVWRDADEWRWTLRLDPVLHIELRRWAHVLVIAPLTANTLAKIACGLCDNLLTNVVRAWDVKNPVILAPAMVSHLYNSAITKRQLREVKEGMPWVEVMKPSEKVVGSYGDIGMGGMVDWNAVVDRVVMRLGGYPEETEGVDEGDGEGEDREVEIDCSDGE